MNIEYHKIEGLYAREETTKKLIEGVYRNPAVEYLKDAMWIFTEKIDGTNIRVYWDGYKVSFAGRTEKALIPTELQEKLNALFGGEVNEQMFEQHFKNKEVILFGEGYGRKIQNGRLYIPDGVSFILFDVMVNGRFLERDEVNEIANAFGIRSVPVILKGTIQEAVDFVKSKPNSTIGIANMEGLVGVPAANLLDRWGNRIIVKVKVRDIEELGRNEMSEGKSGRVRRSEYERIKKDET